MTNHFTETTTQRVRLPPPRANTLAVFAGVLPRNYTIVVRAGHPTQFEKRVASLINSPLRSRGGWSAAHDAAKNAARSASHHPKTLGYPALGHAPTAKLHRIERQTR